jgi:hypothetical protein
MNSTVVIASIPRCGSTYLLRSIAGLPQGEFTPNDYQHRGFVKLHAPTEDIPEGARVIFLFGDIPSAVESTRLNRMTPGHFAKCGATWPPECDIRDKDILGYEAIWDHWTSHEVDSLCVQYDWLVTNTARSAIEEWVGHGIKWLPWKNRTTRTKDSRVRINAAYEGLVRKVNRSYAIFRTQLDKASVPGLG